MWNDLGKTLHSGTGKSGVQKRFGLRYELSKGEASIELTQEDWNSKKWAKIRTLRNPACKIKKAKDKKPVNWKWNYQKDRRRGRRHLGKNYPRGQVKRDWSTSAKCCCKVNYDKGWKLSTRAVSNGALGPKARLRQIWKEYGLFFKKFQNERKETDRVQMERRLWSSVVCLFLF